ncbi:13046_t:CDS:2 [Funneliformis geosporum]|uniref:15033_t:CDS:1 n=1 Tax=Funneliformis geosporum TaxID=1117311 RepID=A0A9W4SVB1_9GLOM|nr:13046_t:CDS:2 [Funneliformis geosporum]CAI2181885.1 15033_t:CDS:2 [Funneliformis geosporum]
MNIVPENLINYISDFVNLNTARDTRDISVKINEGPSLALELDTNLTLEHIRNHFSNPDEELCIYDNMSFNGPKGKITQNDESRKRLGDILIKEGSLEILKILKPLDYPDEREVINKFNLDCGLKISSYGPTRSQKKALVFKKPKTPIEIHKSQYEENVVKICTTSHEELCLKNLIGGVKAALPWSPLSAGLSSGFSLSHERKNQTTHHKETSTDYNVDICVKLRGMINKNEISPTEEFKKDVDEALNSKDPFIELQKLTEQYGEYIILKVKLGGKGLKIINKKLSETAQQKSNKFSFGFNVDSKFAFGGDKIKYENDVQGWKDSLVDFTKWEIIEYEEIEPIFNILDEEQRNKVIKIIVEQKILFRKKESIKVGFSSNSVPYKHELKIPPTLQYDLKKCQIFASVSGEKRVFSVRVVYVSNSSASLLLHKIGNKKKYECYYNLQIDWIIIGYPSNFKMDEFKVISSDNTVDSNSIEIYDQFQKQELCLLATCAYNAPEESNNSPFKSNIVAGVHFCCDDSKLKAFRFTYDLESLKFDHLDENKLSNYFINYSLIKTPSAYYTLSKKISLERSYILYDVSDKHLWIRADKDLKFVSLFNLFNQSNPNDSNLGFANITSEHLVFKSLQSYTKKELHISYFCAPPEQTVYDAKW